MKTPQELAQQMATQTDQQLQDMFSRPADWTPEALDAARAELRRRGIQPAEVAPQEAPNGDRQRNNYATASLVGAIIGFFTIGSAHTESQLQVTATIGGLIGITSLIFGIVALRKVKILRSGKVVAIIGIVLSSLVALSILHVPLDMARHAAERQQQSHQRQ
jgi:hypothetical protein